MGICCPSKSGLFLVLLLLLPIRTAAKAPNLLLTAARVVDTAAWGDPNAWSRFGGEVYWLSDQDALVFQNLTRDYKAEFARYNIAARREAPLEDVSDFYSSTDAYPWTIKMSPDRTWLLWPTETGFAAVKTDGSQHYKIAIEKPEGRKPTFMDRVRANFCWLSDSRHWAEFVQDNSRTITKVVVRNVEKADDLRALNVPAGSPIENLPSDSFGYPTSAGPGTAANNNLLFVTDWLDPNRNHKTIARLDLQGDTVKLTSLKAIVLPDGWDFSNMAFAPMGGRIVWKLVKEGTEPAVNPAHPDKPSRFPRKKMQVSLWVSEVDGSQMHELGEMEAGELAGEPDREILVQPDYVRWLPGGTEVSFMYKGKIFIQRAKSDHAAL